MAHYYEALKDGVIEPRHYVPKKSNPSETRGTSIHDVRKWWKEGRTVCPSVTTVLNVLDKPGLNTWRVDMHLSAAAELAEQAAAELAEQIVLAGAWRFDRRLFLDECKRRTELEMDKAPAAGTDIHKSLEAWFSGDLVPDEHKQICENVATEIVLRTGGRVWLPERNFLHPMGFAGQCDLSGNGWVIDFKSKQTADKFRPGKMAYNEHRMQLAAYREGLNMPNARCANVFICLEDGQVDFHEHAESELATGWEVFKCALRIWQLQNGHGPGGNYGNVS